MKEGLIAFGVDFRLQPSLFDPEMNLALSHMERIFQALAARSFATSERDTLTRKELPLILSIIPNSH
jgi:hypothetical protein